MPRTSTLRLGEGLRLADGIAIGVLTRNVPVDQVHRVLAETGRSSRRNRDLPAHVMVYYVIALALYRAEGSREVLRLLLEGLQMLLGWGRRIIPAAKSAISQARSRLGEEPLKRLYSEIAVPIATAQTEGAFYRHWRKVAIDGTTLELPDTDANVEAFGRPTADPGSQSAYPLLRLVGLVETGTHAMFAAALGSYTTAETTLARQILPALRPGMLCLADRYFPGYELWKEAVQTGADLVWRVQRGIYLPCEKRLPDGSYLSHFYPKKEKNKPRTGGIPVRVVEYRVKNPEGKWEYYRLVTTILDPEAAPAEELAQLYHERWEFETSLDEFKTHLRGARTVLRSQTPELVRQECWGLLLAHFALRGLMHEAALREGRDPDRISFIHTVRVVRRSLPHFAALPPSEVEETA
jgi:Insertion element 4 transposase N-terminal/Transposase DDE domain